ncbi:MAG: HAMP domain-containing protein, partial [Acidobacteria bacterium]|nr:HAMP domain-containing protein [Acidobacteriota bacterium]
MSEEQSRALVAGITIGSNGITSSEYMQDIVDEAGQTFFDEAVRSRIKDVIIINNDWQVHDSLNPALVPSMDDAGIANYQKLGALTDLPPLMEGGRLGEDIANFPNRKTAANENFGDEAHAVPIETSKGRWYVMVLLKNDKGLSAWRAARPLIYTLGVLLVSSLITFWLVWRFSRPIADLSDAARRVADGDLSVRVPNASRHNELGRLTQNFNEMTAELQKKRDLETQLQHAEKSAVVGRLGSAIAHEIRNPLNYINLSLDHLRTSLAPNDLQKRATVERLTTQLKAEVARINTRISEFLSYTRPAQLEMHPIDLRAAVEDALRLVEVQATESNIETSIEAADNIPHVRGDAESLRSLFTNLIINAVQAMEGDDAGGRLTITLSANEAGRACVDVTDTG